MLSSYFHGAHSDNTRFAAWVVLEKRTVKGSSLLHCSSLPKILHIPSLLGGWQHIDIISCITDPFPTKGRSYAWDTIRHDQLGPCLAKCP